MHRRKVERAIRYFTMIGGMYVVAFFGGVVFAIGLELTRMIFGG